MAYANFALVDMYGAEKGQDLLNKVKEAVFELFEKYSNKIALLLSGFVLKKRYSESSSTSSMGTIILEDGQAENMIWTGYQKYLPGHMDNKNELDKYLGKNIDPQRMDFDILSFIES